MNQTEYEGIYSTDRDLADCSEIEVQDLIQGEILGKEVHLLKEVDSTNLYAAKLAHRGAPEGTVVIADCQTQGRGRLNRVWQSPPGKNLYTSIILRPPIEPSVAPQLTLTAGVAVAELLSHYCPDDVTLKWPNDIQVKRKKICGILTEMRTLGVTIDYVIVGIGININMTKEEFQEDFREISTSLKEELGSAMSRTQFAILLYKCFEKWYTLYERNGFEFVRDTWLRYSGILGKYIRVNDRESFQHGEVLGIDEYGALLIFDDEKKLKRILSGDVTLIGD